MDPLEARDHRWLFLVGRLTRGATVPEVQARLDAETSAMARDWPDTHAQRGARFRRFAERNSELRSLGIWRAADEAELHEKVLDTLPLRPWMTLTVTPLESHPNDPGMRALAPLLAAER